MRESETEKSSKGQELVNDNSLTKAYQLLTLTVSFSVCLSGLFYRLWVCALLS